MKLRATVTKTTGNTKHGIGRMVSGQQTLSEFPPVAWLEIVETADGVYLLRYDAHGACGADTWHTTIDEAKVQAEFEYSVSNTDWYTP